MHGNITGIRKKTPPSDRKKKKIKTLCFVYFRKIKKAKKRKMKKMKKNLLQVKKNVKKKYFFLSV